MSSFKKDIKRLLKEEKESKKINKLKIAPVLKNTLNKLNPFKNDKFKKILNPKDKEEVKKVADNQPVLDSTTSDEDSKNSILAMEQFALNLLDNEKYTMTVDNDKYDIEHFIGTLHGIKMTNPNLFMNMMKNKNIKKSYEKYETKYPYTHEKKSGGTDTQSAKVPSDKKGQIKYIQKAVGTKDDGDWGKQTNAKWKEWIVSDGVTKAIEKILGVKNEPKKETPQKTPPKTEKKPEVQKESLNRKDLRNILETMAYFPHLNEVGPDVMTQPEGGGSKPEKLKYRVSAGFQDDGEKFYTFIKFTHNRRKKTNTLPKKDAESIIKTYGPDAGGKFDNDKAISLATTLLGPGTTEDNVQALTGEKGQEEQNKGIGREVLITLAKKAVESFNKGPVKKTSKTKKSTPKSDNMGRQGKMGEIAKNRGNASAIAKMLGFEGNLSGVANAVAKIKSNMPAPISENKKLFNTLRKYKIL